MDALSAIETRVLGCLLEKAVTTPDQYPLTLNAIITACNQKSSREPIMNLAQGEVQRALRLLEDKLLVSADPNLRGRVEKYVQRFCKTPFGMYEFNPAQYAVITVLMLRGPQTPGELKTRCERMHAFAGPEAVEETLLSLRDREGGAVVVELPREPNRRDPNWAQLFSEDADGYKSSAPATSPAPVQITEPATESSTTPAAIRPESAAAPESERVAVAPTAAPVAKTGNGLDRLAALEDRVEKLESAMQRLQEALGE